MEIRAFVLAVIVGFLLAACGTTGNDYGPSYGQPYASYPSYAAPTPSQASNNKPYYAVVNGQTVLVTPQGSSAAPVSPCCANSAQLPQVYAQPAPSAVVVLQQPYLCPHGLALLFAPPECSGYLYGGYPYGYGYPYGGTSFNFRFGGGGGWHGHHH